MVVRQLHKHNGTNWDCLVPEWLSDHKHDGTKWDCLVPHGWSDIITNTIGQIETVWYLKGCQTTSQTRWDKLRLVSTSSVVRQLQNTMGQSETVYYLKGCQTTSHTQWDNVRLFSTSRVFRQLHKHDGTKLDCLVPQWLSDNFTNTMGQSETLVPLGLSDNFTNTMGQSETV